MFGPLPSGAGFPEEVIPDGPRAEEADGEASDHGTQQHARLVQGSAYGWNREVRFKGDVLSHQVCV